MKRAICLGGGGAKGAYEIGVLKALRKLKIKYDIVCGTSVGALNGIFYVQKDYYKAVKIWRNMNFNLLFDESIIEKFNNLTTTKDMIMMFSSNYISNKGMDVTKLEDLVKRYFNSHKFFKSNIDYSLSVYNFSKMTGEKYRKSDLNKDNFIDFVMASSSCYPAFKKRKIKNYQYIDGGFFDNLPINSAIDMEADEIIAINLRAPGFFEIIKNKKIPITYITPKHDIGGFLNFNRTNANRAIKYGYLDTLLVYKKITGNDFYFKNHSINRNMNRFAVKYIKNFNIVFDYIENKNTFEEIIRKATFKKLSSINSFEYNSFVEIMEYLGKIFDLDDTVLYSANRFNYKLLKSIKNINKVYDINKMPKDNVLNKQRIIKYFYDKIEKSYKNSNIRKEITLKAFKYPKEFLGALYLKTISRSYLIW